MEAHLGACSRCRDDVEGLFDALTDLSEGVSRPGDRVFRRLQASVGRVERFTVHVPLLSDLLDLPANDVRLLLHDFDDAWPEVVPGVALRPFAAGPAQAERGSLAVLARVQPGAAIPPHRHVGPEHTLVLEGAFTDDDGGGQAGSLVTRPAGLRHLARGAGDSPCLAIIVMEGGIGAA